MSIYLVDDIVSIIMDIEIIGQVNNIIKETSANIIKINNKKNYCRQKSILSRSYYLANLPSRLPVSNTGKHSQ